MRPPWRRINERLITPIDNRWAAQRRPRQTVRSAASLKCVTGVSERGYRYHDLPMSLFIHVLTDAAR